MFISMFVASVIYLFMKNINLFTFTLDRVDILRTVMNYQVSRPKTFPEQEVYFSKCHSLQRKLRKSGGLAMLECLVFMIYQLN